MSTTDRQVCGSPDDLHVVPAAADHVRAAASMTARVKPQLPDRAWEESLHAAGCDIVVGIDEVGKGAWAGPMAVGAVVIPKTGDVPEVRDSKTLSERRREILYDAVVSWCVSWSVGFASASECDELGMVAAQRLATRRALESLDVVPDAAVVDGNWDFVSPAVARVETRVKGDASSVSIAAASIVAKVTRDRLMRQLATDYPMWSFDTNKGYPCPRHRTALQGYGPSAIHRRSWSFMDTMIPWPGVVRQERQGLLF